MPTVVENPKGWTIEMETGEDEWEKIANIVSLKLPDPEQQYDTATHLESTCDEVNTPVGIATPGTCSGQCLYKPSGVHVDLANAAGEEDTEVKNFRIKRKSGVVHCTFPATCKKFSVSAQVKSFMKADFEFPLTEPPVYGDVTP